MGGTRAILAIALTVGAVAGGCVAAAGPASAATPGGSILYVKKNNVYAITADGRHSRQLTHDGRRKTRNHTGGVGYLAPSASSSGRTIVTVRNQHVSAADTQGYVHVLNRDGRGIRTFKPLQFKHVKLNTSPCQSVQEPRGILNAYVSPDGKHIAYTVETRVRSADCNAAVGYSTFVVNTNGTGAHEIKRSNGNGASLESGMWAGNKRLLLDDIDFGSQGFWYVNLPSHTARRWTQASDFTDGTWELPALHDRKLASVGYSNVTNGKAMRLWTAGGPPARPTGRCDLRTPVRGETVDRPSWSPDSTAIAFAVDDNTPSKLRAGEGLYVMTVGASLSSSSCASPHQLVHGGSQPFWTPATLTHR
jgi:hypothetical protein